MTTTLTLDKAGRVVIPKPWRDQLGLGPGDSLHLEMEGERILLRPVRQTMPLRKERGLWVYRSGRPLPSLSIPDLIDRDREARAGDLVR